jgi:predicted NBD/HSP70 family sugar kinase
MNRLTVKDIRAKNKYNVLNTIINNNGITRIELAKLTNVSLMTITNVVDELLTDKFIYEIKTESSIGRTPSNLYIDETQGIFISIDFTSLSSCDYIIYNIKRQIIFNDTFQLDISVSYLDNIYELLKIIDHAITKFNLVIQGIGIAVPGAYIPQTDTVRTSLIKEHQNINFYKIFSEYFKCENIVMGHDVNMAARAEMNALSPESSIFYIYIGEGVGGTYVNNGRVNTGIDLLAGDIGQIIISYNNSEISLEELLSLPSIEKYAKDNFGVQGINEIIRKYLEDDNKIVPYIDSVLKVLSNEIYNLTWLFNPDYIVISSSSKQFARLITEYANKAIDNKKRNNDKKSAYFINTKIISSYYSENPALIGILSVIINNYIEKCSK